MPQTRDPLAKLGTTQREMVERILDTWHRATPANVADGAAWYGEAFRIASEIAEASGYTIDQTVAAMAHLSPRQFWARNVSLTWRLVWAHDTWGIMRAAADRAFSALESKDPLSTLKGKKTAAFARNILGDTEAVTVDVWAARVALDDVAGDGRVLELKGVYDAIADAYRVAARRVGVEPSVMQAVTWIVARNGRAG